MLHALDARIIQVTKEEDLDLALHIKLLYLQIKVFMTRMLLNGLGRAAILMSKDNVNEAYNPRGNLILWSFDHYDEFLAHLGTNLDGNVLLQFLAHRIFDEPAIKLILRILDVCAIFVAEGQLISIVLSEGSVAIVHFIFGNAHCHNLVLV